MRRSLRSAALIVCFAAISFWIVMGANRGWTKTSVPVKVVDEVTGIQGVSYQKRFLPGLDFLGSALLLAAILSGASFIFRGPASTPHCRKEVGEQTVR